MTAPNSDTVAPVPFMPKEIRLIVGISGSGNLIGPSAFCTSLQYLENEKLIVEGYSNSLPTRITLLGMIAGLKALKSSCNVTIVAQNELIINAFEEGWILDWEAKGLLKRKTTKIKHTDLYGQLFDAIQGHAVKFRQPQDFGEESKMTTLKNSAQKRKKVGPWIEDIEKYVGDESQSALF